MSAARELLKRKRVRTVKWGRVSFEFSRSQSQRGRYDLIYRCFFVIAHDTRRDRDNRVTNVCSSVVIATDETASLSIVLFTIAEIAVVNTGKFAQQEHAIGHTISLSLSLFLFLSQSFITISLNSLVFSLLIFYRTNFALISRAALIFPRI